MKDELIALALFDEHHIFRSTALSMLEEADIKKYNNQIAKMAKEDKHSSVRQTATSLLSIIDVPNKVEILEEILSKEKSFPVMNSALGLLYNLDKIAAQKYIKLFSDDKNFESELAKIYATEGDEKYNDWFIEKFSKGNLYEKYETAGAYVSYISKQPEDKINNAVSLFNGIAKNKERHKYDRFIATASLAGIKSVLTEQSPTKYAKVLRTIDLNIKEIKVQEKDPELIERYSQM
jgi:hypothetical protein